MSFSLNANVVTAPQGGWEDGDSILTSPVQNNSNGRNSVKITVKYEVLTPDGKDALVGYELRTVIEEELSPGVWSVVAAQHNTVKGTDEALEQQVILTPQFTTDPGIPEIVSGGPNGQNLAEISRTDGVAPEKYRVCVVYRKTDATRPQLTSATISMFGNEYDR